jgi:hypothetical protein
VNAADLLSAAVVLLDEELEDTAAVWPRGCAVLTRQAIEVSRRAYWDATVPAMNGATAKEQWLALPAYLGRNPGVGAAEYAWAALSEACHQRAYEVGLTEAELRAHVQTADAFRILIGQALQRRAAPAELPS